jgi:hypothetical protein
MGRYEEEAVVAPGHIGGYRLAMRIPRRKKRSEIIAQGFL